MSKLKQMRQIVRDELKHIPRSSLPQAELRLAYWHLRMHSLGRKAEKEKTPGEVLKESIAQIRPEYPDFKFEYDAEFFRK
jgi:hypothetical protein